MEFKGTTNIFSLVRSGQTRRIERVGDNCDEDFERGVFIPTWPATENSIYLPL